MAYLLAWVTSLAVWPSNLGALLVVSGIGYLLLSSTLAPTAYVSGLRRNTSSAPDALRHALKIGRYC